MSSSCQTILDDFNACIKKPNSSQSDWYVGITKNVEQRLFDDHKVVVEEEERQYIYRRASSSEVARKVEKKFRDLGCDGGPGGGDENACFVYAYLKTPSTSP